MRRVALALLLVVVSTGLVSAQPEQKPVAKSTTKKPPPDLQKPAHPAAGHASPPAASRLAQTVDGEVDIHFLNGSNVRMQVLSDKLEIATLYGKLSVPVKDIRAIQFGVHYPEGVHAKINAAMSNLGSGSYRQREQASKTLVDLGPYSYATVYEASRSKDLETARRATDILKQLRLRHRKKDLKMSDDDKVVTPAFTIAGRILTTTIKAKTEYFGTVELSLAKMRTLRSVGRSLPEVDLTIDAAKYANAGQWLETEFEVDGRTPLVITAKGTVDTWPQQPGQWLVGPNGQAAPGAMAGGIIVRGGRGGAVAQQGGILFGKIGQDGAAFVIGERYESTPEETGKLYLHIGPSPWNCQSTGMYEVKIRNKD